MGQYDRLKIQSVSVTLNSASDYRANGLTDCDRSVYNTANGSRNNRQKSALTVARKKLISCTDDWRSTVQFCNGRQETQVYYASG